MRETSACHSWWVGAPRFELEQVKALTDRRMSIGLLLQETIANREIEAKIAANPLQGLAPNKS